VIALLTSLAILGLAAIDPIGIAAMPILLVREKPLLRSFIFLGGSFVALIAMGLLFARGLGKIVLNFDNAHAWLVPSIEASAGLILLVIAGTFFWRMKRGKPEAEPSEAMVKRLQLGSWQLFVGGVFIVAVQSIVDIVFVIAMIRIGKLNLSTISLSIAVVTYAVAALVLQLAVIVAYKLTPPNHRKRTLARVHHLLANYASQALIGVSFLLGCVLLLIAT